MTDPTAAAASSLSEDIGCFRLPSNFSYLHANPGRAWYFSLEIESIWATDPATACRPDLDQVKLNGIFTIMIDSLSLTAILFQFLELLHIGGKRFASI